MSDRRIIVQSNKNDRSTDDVLTWLYHLAPEVKIERLFDMYCIKDLKIELSNCKKLCVSVDDLVVDKHTPYWYRRGSLKFGVNQDRHITNQMEKTIFSEYIDPLMQFINEGSSSHLLNKYNDNYMGKLEMLYHAMELGIKVPSTLVTTRLTDVQAFIHEHEKIISKPVKNPFTDAVIDSNPVWFLNPNTLITSDMLEGVSDEFLPSFFQEYIDKKFEIRSFYMNGEFYSMAIFSQENEQTKVDFRNYDYERPNRLLPFNLPDEICGKLTLLMKKLGLNSGSFDIIYTPQHEYYFLEVNPIGQFQWLSHNCNYYLEKKIASHLINHSVEQ